MANAWLKSVRYYIAASPLLMHGLNTALRQCQYSDIEMGLSGERYSGLHGWGSPQKSKSTQ